MSQIITKGITDLAVTNAKVATGLAATKIADGSVSDAEFQFINSLTSNAQTQLNEKASTTLNNLGTTSINSDLLPSADGTRKLGSTILKWNTAHINTLNDASDTLVLHTVNRTLNATDNSTAITFSSPTIVTANKALRVLNGIVDASSALTLDADNRQLYDNSGGLALDFNAIDTVILNSDQNTVAPRVLQFNDETDIASVSVSAPAGLAGNVTFVLPPTNGTSGQVLRTNGAGVTTWVTVAAGETRAKETFVLNGTDITNQFITLANTPAANSVHLVVKGLPPTLEGASYDYTITGAQIDFENDLATGGAAALIAGDIIQVTYEY